jgi:hypothetical protein
MERQQRTVKPRRPLGGLPGPVPPSRDTAPTKQSVGRPKGVPSTIVNVRLPRTLVAALDRYLDRLERQTGLKANRGMIARRALERFLASHASAEATLSAGSESVLSPITRDGRA